MSEKSGTPYLIRSKRMKKDRADVSDSTKIAGEFWKVPSITWICPLNVYTFTNVLFYIID